MYVRIYTPAKGGDARDYYPFPQIMSPDGVAALIAGGDVVWLVGEAPDGTLVGSAAAMRNIGDASDQISEVFGVVVDAAHRHGGLGSALVGGLVDELAGSSKFILCEARTDDAGGWKVARNAGFVPVGYGHTPTPCRWGSSRWCLPAAGGEHRVALSNGKHRGRVKPINFGKQ